jgi:peroxiredoxin
MNDLRVVKVRGSKTEELKNNFNDWLIKLKTSEKMEEEKQEAYYQKLAGFVKSHPADRLSPYLVSNATTLYFYQVQELSKLYDSSLKKAYEGSNVAKLLNRLDKSKRSIAGVAFKDFLLKDTSGREVNTKQLRGKYTLVVFWSSSCVPCRVEHPELDDLYHRYGGKGLKMVGISLDYEHEKWVKAIARDKLHWPQVSDLKKRSEIGDYYGLIETGVGIPFNILIDKEGKIVDRQIPLKEMGSIFERLL